MPRGKRYPEYVVMANKEILERTGCATIEESVKRKLIEFEEWTDALERARFNVTNRGRIRYGKLPFLHPGTSFAWKQLDVEYSYLQVPILFKLYFQGEIPISEVWTDIELNNRTAQARALVILTTAHYVTRKQALRTTFYAITKEGKQLVENILVDYKEQDIEIPYLISI